jgi:hypothetical protein
MLAAPTLPAEAAEPLRLLALCLCVRFGDGIALGGAGFMGTSDDIDPGDPGDLGERDG